jgi:hypothetical protein
MALLEKHRTRLYAHLVDHIDEETAEAVLAQFPSRDLDEPVTKEFVALTASELRTDLAELRTEMHQEIGLLRTEMHQEIGLLRTDMHQEIGLLRTEMHQEIGLLRTDLHKQTERLLNRVQLVAALSVIALSVVNAVVG